MNKLTILIGLIAAAACAPVWAHTDQGKAKNEAGAVTPGGSYGIDPADAGLGADLGLAHIEDIIHQEEIAAIVRSAPRRGGRTVYDIDVDIPAGGGASVAPGTALGTSVPAPGGAALLGLAGIVAARRRRR